MTVEVNPAKTPTVFVFRIGNVVESILLNGHFFSTDGANIVTATIDVSKDDAEALRRIGLRLSRAASAPAFGDQIVENVENDKRSLASGGDLLV